MEKCQIDVRFAYRDIALFSKRHFGHVIRDGKISNSSRAKANGIFRGGKNFSQRLLNSNLVLSARKCPGCVQRVDVCTQFAPPSVFADSQQRRLL